MADDRREIKELARHIASLERQIQSQRAPQLAHSSLEDGSIGEYDDEGNLVGRIGVQPDGSHAYVPYVGPTPPIPNAPTVTIKPGLFRVGWDGSFVDPITYVVDPAIVAPDDFARVEVHVGTTAAFTPDVLPASTTRVGTFETAGGGQVTHLPDAVDTTYYVRLVTRSTPGKFSEPSVSTEVVVPPAVDNAQLIADLEALEQDLIAAQGEIDTLQNVTLPALQSDLDANEAAVNTLQTVTLPALQGEVDANEAALSTLTGTTLPALQSDLDAAEASITTLTGTTIPALQSDLDAAEADVNTLETVTIPALAGRLTDAENEIDTTLPGAIAEAQEAAEMALKIAPVSTDAPVLADGTGRPTGAIWTRIDASGGIIGYWRWDGDSWEPHTLTATVIPNLSAAKITSGTIATARLNATEIAASIATIISLNADRITSGTISTDRLDATSIAAAIATIIELNADRITSGTISTDRLNTTTLAAALATIISLDAGRITSGTIATARLNATEIAASIATIISLNADRITSGTISTLRLNTTEIAAAVATVIELNASRITSGTIATARLNATEIAAAVATVIELNADRITSGTINTARLNTVEIAANIANIVTVKAENIQAGYLNVTVSLGVGGELRLGDLTETHIRQVNNEIAVYAPPEQTPDGSLIPAKKMTALGGAVGAAFTAFDPVTGDELGGIRADGEVFSPHVDAGTITLAGDLDVETMLRQSAGQTIASGENSVLHSNYTGETALVGMRVLDVKAGHLYRIFIKFRGRVTPSTAYADAKLRYTTGTTMPTTSSSLIASEAWSVPSNTSITGAYFFQYTWRPTSDYDRVNLLFTIQPSSTGTCTSRSYELDVVDEGIPTITSLYDAFVTAPVEPFSAYYRFTEHYPYTQYGLVTNSAYKPHLVRHGTGGSSNYRTFLPLPSTARSKIAGASTVSKIEIELTQAQDQWGVDPYIGTYTGSPGTGTTISNSVSLPGPSKPGESRWMELNSTQRAAIVAGANIVVGKSTSLPLASYYGPGASTVSYRPRIRITGTE